MFLHLILYKIGISHLLKRLPRQQAIGPGLMALSNRPVHVQNFSNPVQTAVETLAKPHQVLHIVHVIAEENPKNAEEFVYPIWKASLSQNLNQIPKIVGAVKRHPTH